ncbi:TolC family protein [Clostridium sp. OS1-26]|uniref:TolC family protein n=1 Tax=Clostridium sp. OS1-26 TaxID=3070681 RepID=UPI0027E0AACB|nr:TolC family protein [Clostridium sp. OS1-26]WML36739.1 TolC family protein [Clostridium sp. OS1-26]
MKKKFIIPMVLTMTVAISMPIYVSADTAATSAASNTNVTVSDTSTNAPAAPTKLSLSLEDALNRVEKGYNQIVLDDKYIEILDRQHQNEIGRKDSLKKTSGSAPSEDEAKILNYNVPVALYNLNDKKHQREVDLKSAKVTITTEYQNILAAQLKVELINKQIANLQKQIDLTKEKIKVGMAKDSDLDTYKASMATLQANLSSVKIAIDSSMITLKNDLGLDLDTELTLTSKPMEYVKYDGSKVDAQIQGAIDNSYSLKALQQQIDNENILIDLYNRYGDTKKSTEDITLQGLKDQLDLKPNAIKVQLKVQYNSLKSLEDGVEADKFAIEAAQISLDLIQQKYNLGQAIYLEVFNAQLQLDSAKNTLQQDIISYMTAVTSFQNSLELQ